MILLGVLSFVGSVVSNIYFYRRGYMTGWKDSAEHQKMMQGRP